jgi:arginase family enzyme
MSFHP